MFFTPHFSIIGELTEINQAPKADSKANFTAQLDSNSMRLSMNLDFSSS